MKITGVIINSAGDMIAAIYNRPVSRAMKLDAICVWEASRDTNGALQPVNVNHYRITTARRALDHAARRNDLAAAYWRDSCWLLRY